MTKNIWPFLLAACLPFHGKAQEKHFLIEGTIQADTAVKGFICLQYDHQDGSYIRDTAYIHQNTYRFEGHLENEDAICANLFWHTAPGPNFAGFAQYYVGADTVRVVHQGGFNTFTVSGSPAQEDNGALKKLMKQDERHLFIYQHPDSWISFLTLSKLVVSSNADTAMALYAALSPRLKQYPTVAELGNRIKGMNVAVGMQAPDFTEADTSGRPVSLSAFRGKYVLVSFWASWCHSCRAENSFLVPDYNKYKEKGFEILGVSLDGGSPIARELWVKAMRTDKTPWAQVSDLHGFKDPVAIQYGIAFIPRNFLVDPGGKIIARDLDETTLPQALDSVLVGPFEQKKLNK
jgi:peroxiredoxin